MTADERSAQVAAVFDSVADTYDEVGIPWFEPIAAGLVDALEPGPGESMLDVGCGKGAVTFRLAAKVGADGVVVGVDLSEQMLARAAALAEARGVENVRWHCSDASVPEQWAGGFDAVASSLVLFFLPQPVSALAAWRETLRSGGRAGVTTFGRNAEAIDALDATFRPFLPPAMLDARTSGAAGPFSTDQGVEQLFVDAGFSQVSTQHFDVVLELADVEMWERFSRSHGQSAMWRHVPVEQHDEVRSAAETILAAHRDSDGMVRAHNDIRVTLARR